MTLLLLCLVPRPCCCSLIPKQGCMVLEHLVLSWKGWNHPRSNSRAYVIFTFPWGWGMPPHPPSTLLLQLGWLLHTQIVCNCGSGTTVWSGCNSTCMGGGRREEGAWGGREWGREWGSMQCKVPISDLPSNWSVLSQERKSGLCRYVAWQHCHNRVVLGCISAHTRVAWGVLRLVQWTRPSFLILNLTVAQCTKSVNLQWKTSGPDISKPLSFSKFGLPHRNSSHKYWKVKNITNLINVVVWHASGDQTKLEV